MKELENEYRKRLNFYKGYTQNQRYFDTNYDRVFEEVSQEEPQEGAYDGVYSGSDTQDIHMPLNITVTPSLGNRGEDDLCRESKSTIRNTYTGVENSYMCDRHRQHFEEPYNDKKVRFAEIIKNTRSCSINNRSKAFDMYKSKSSNR